MQNESTTWSPQVGDLARIKESGLTGTVVKTKGVYEARFRVRVLPPTVADSAAALKRARAAARAASRWYGLDELGPPW